MLEVVEHEQEPLRSEAILELVRVPDREHVGNRTRHEPGVAKR